MTTLEKIQKLVNEEYSLEVEENNSTFNVTKDYAKFFERGNVSAGTRLRKAMQELKKLAHELRVEVQENRKNAK